MSPAGFHHRDHIRPALRLVREFGVTPAPAAMARAIQHVARIVGYHADGRPELTDFEQFIAAYPQLLNKELPARHWRRETLYSEAARAAWVEPDVLALPN